MALRALLRHLLNNEQLIQKLADSYPIRRAAQLTAYMFHKGKEIGEDKLEKLKETDAFNRLQHEAKHTAERAEESASRMQEKANSSYTKANRFFYSFFSNLQEEWKKAEEKLEEQKRLEEKNKKDR